MLLTNFINALYGLIFGMKQFFMNCIACRFVSWLLNRTWLYFRLPIKPPSYRVRMLRIIFASLCSHSFDALLIRKGRTDVVQNLEFPMYSTSSSLDGDDNNVLHMPCRTGFLLSLLSLLQWTFSNSVSVSFFLRLNGSPLWWYWWLVVSGHLNYAVMVVHVLCLHSFCSFQ